MKRFCLLGVLALVLAGCGGYGKPDPVFKAKKDAQDETTLIYVIRSAQADYEKYLQRRLDECKAGGQILTRDQDGILVCATPPKKSEENK